MAQLDLQIRRLEELDEIERLGLLDFSYSRISTFEWCEAQYFYKYILKKPDKYGDKALLGNMVHKAVELTETGGEKLDREELMRNYSEARLYYDPDLSIVSEELIEAGHEMLEMYVIRKGTKPSQLTEAESYFEFAFHGVLLRGYIDQMFVSEDAVSLLDLKTGAWEVADKDLPTYLQLGIYALWAKYLYPDKNISSTLYYMKSDKRKTHHYTDEDLLIVRDKLKQTIDEIKDKRNFHPKPIAWKCRMCAFSEDGSCPIGQKTVVDKNRMLKYDSSF